MSSISSLSELEILIDLFLIISTVHGYIGPSQMNEITIYDFFSNIKYLEEKITNIAYKIISAR